MVKCLDENYAFLIKNEIWLLFIRTKACLPIAIMQLQKQGIPLFEAVKMFQDIWAKFNVLTGTARTVFNKKKYKQFLTKTKDFKLFVLFKKY